jgi:hypothetical protein
LESLLQLEHLIRTRASEIFACSLFFDCSLERQIAIKVNSKMPHDSRSSTIDSAPGLYTPGLWFSEKPGLAKFWFWGSVRNSFANTPNFPGQPRKDLNIIGLLSACVMDSAGFPTLTQPGLYCLGSAVRRSPKAKADHLNQIPSQPTFLWTKKEHGL